MVPLKISIYLASPKCIDSDYPIHLDGLLAWCVKEEAESIGHENPWEASNNLSHLLATEKTPGSDEWVWKASAIKFTPISEPFWINMVRTLNHADFAEFQRKGLFRQKRSYLQSGSGQDRNYQLFMPYQWFSKGEAWCVGDKELIIEMLSRVATIGKQGRNGFGQVAKIEVEESDEALDLWKLRFLPRNINGAKGVEYFPSVTRLHPPYWKNENRVATKEPAWSR